MKGKRFRKWQICLIENNSDQAVGKREHCECGWCPKSWIATRKNDYTWLYSILMPHVAYLGIHRIQFWISHANLLSGVIPTRDPQTAIPMCWPTATCKAGMVPGPRVLFYRSGGLAIGCIIYKSRWSKPNMCEVNTASMYNDAIIKMYLVVKSSHRQWVIIGCEGAELMLKPSEGGSGISNWYMTQLFWWLSWSWRMRFRSIHILVRCELGPFAESKMAVSPNLCL